MALGLRRLSRGMKDDAETAEQMRDIVRRARSDDEIVQLAAGTWDDRG
jgi:hypothetical protein